MTTPDQPDNPPLTRRQLRLLRETGAIPVIDPVDESSDRPRTPRPEINESDIDLDAPPRSRREARIQERLRTASIAVVPAETPVDEAAAETDGVVEPAAETIEAETVVTGPSAVVEVDAEADEAEVTELVQVDDAAVEDAPVDDAPAEDVADEDVASDDVASAEDADHATAADSDADAEGVAPTDADSEPVTEGADDATDAEASDGEADAPASERTVAAGFGADLLAGNEPAVELPASFDQLLTRASASTGSIATPNALILSQTPEAGPLMSPISSTGEVLITGSYNLPETLGSTGAAPGTQDNRETDAVLVDGELPAHSSPTPLAASAAVSSVKATDDVIRPPAPEKGSRIMMVLAITAGVLAVALAGVLILAFVTGVFSQ